MDVILILSIYFIGVNLLGFIMMGIDKRKAVKQKFRIPELTLFIISIIGGSLGSLLAMYSFRHKTKKKKFKFGIPFIIIIQLLIVFLLTYSNLEFLIL